MKLSLIVANVIFGFSAMAVAKEIETHSIGGRDLQNSGGTANLESIWGLGTPSITETAGVFTVNFPHGSATGITLEVFAEIGGPTDGTPSNACPSVSGFAGVDSKGTGSSSPTFFQDVVYTEGNAPGSIYATQLEFAFDSTVSQDSSYCEGCGFNDALVSLCFRLTLDDGTDNVSFREIALDVDFTLVDGFNVASFTAEAYAVNQAFEDFFFTADASLCGSQGTPIEPGEAACINVCTADYPLAEIKEIYSLVISGVLPSGGVVTQESIDANAVSSSLTSPVTCGVVGAQYCCQVDTILLETFFESSIATSSVTATGTAMMSVGSRRQLVKVPSDRALQLEDERVDANEAEFATEIILAEQPSNSGAGTAANGFMAMAAGAALLI